MSDNKDSRDGRDRSKVDSNDTSEVEYVHQQYPHLSHEQVLEAIKAHGPNREAINAFLEKQK
jgi:hypothetical protein